MFTVDNEVLSVEYNEVQLEIRSDYSHPHLDNWATTKKFNFIHDGMAAKNELRIKGDNWGPEPNCIWAGLLLHCEAKNANTGVIVPANPWHNFTSNLEQWKSEDGRKLCASDGGIVEISKDNPAIQALVANGAVKIWGGEHNTSTLIGSPDFHFTQEDPTCSIIPSLFNFMGFISCFLETTLSISPF